MPEQASGSVPRSRVDGFLGEGYLDAIGAEVRGAEAEIAPGAPLRLGHPNSSLQCSGVDVGDVPDVRSVDRADLGSYSNRANTEDDMALIHLLRAAISNKNLRNALPKWLSAFFDEQLAGDRSVRGARCGALDGPPLARRQRILAGGLVRLAGVGAVRRTDALDLALERPAGRAMADWCAPLNRRAEGPPCNVGGRCQGCARCAGC